MLSQSNQPASTCAPLALQKSVRDLFEQQQQQQQTKREQHNEAPTATANSQQPTAGQITVDWRDWRLAQDAQDELRGQIQPVTQQTRDFELDLQICHSLTELSQAGAQGRQFGGRTSVAKKNPAICLALHLDRYLTQRRGNPRNTRQITWRDRWPSSRACCSRADNDGYAEQSPRGHPEEQVIFRRCFRNKPPDCRWHSRTRQCAPELGSQLTLFTRSTSSIWWKEAPLILPRFSMTHSAQSRW
jgi:hypothetical protein